MGALPSQAGHSHAWGRGSAAPRLDPSFQPWGRPSLGDVCSGKQEHACSSPAVLSLGEPRSSWDTQPRPTARGTDGAVLVQPLTGQRALLHETRE